MDYLSDWACSCKDKRIVDKFELLVCPPGNTYFSMNTQIHGIAARHTCNAPTFSSVWPIIKRFIENQTVVAHNGAFDFSCLSQALTYYNIAIPKYEQHCTYKIYGKALKDCCRHYGIALNHHNALSDALACAELFQLHLNSK